MSELRGLLERVRAATNGTSQENYNLNVDLGKALLGWNLYEHKAFGDYDTDWAEWRDAEGNQMRIMPDHINSIDVALALVNRLLPDWMWTIYHEYVITEKPNEVFLKHRNIDLPLEVGEARGDHDTVPLAVLSALLSALIAKESSNDQ